MRGRNVWGAGKGIRHARSPGKSIASMRKKVVNREKCEVGVSPPESLDHFPLEGKREGGARDEKGKAFLTMKFVPMNHKRKHQVAQKEGKRYIPSKRH